MPVRAPCPRSLPQKTAGPNRHTCIPCGPIHHIWAGHPGDIAAKVPQKALIGLATRVVAAGIPHYTTINSLWGRTPWSCGKSTRCGQTRFPETFAPYVPKIVLMSWPPVSRRHRGTAPSSPTELPREVVFSRPAGSRPTHLHLAIPAFSHVYIHIYT